MHRQVAVIGEGEISAAVVLLLAVRGGADVTVVQDAGEAAARDAGAAAGLLGGPGGARVRAVAALSQAPGAAVAVVTTSDAEELEALAPQLARHAPDAVVVAAGEPADVACALLLAETTFPRARVLGAAAGARQARLRAAIARAAGVWPGDVDVDVLGGVGTRCVPLLSRATIAGVPAADVVGAEALEALAAEVGAGGTGGAALAAAAVCDVVEAVLGDQRRVLTCAAACRGELGLQDRVTAVPVRLGRHGVEAFVEPPMSLSERDALLRAAIRMR
jgi:malate/lactate dehydrogenase